MAKISDLYIKRATLVALKADAAVIALVPVDRLFPIQMPSDTPRPNGNFGVPSTVPLTATCMDGSECSFAFHSWTETHGDGVGTVSGEDEAIAINAAIAAALDNAALDLADRGCPYPATAYYTVTSTTVIRDGNDAGKFHGVVNFLVTVSS